MMLPGFFKKRDSARQSRSRDGARTGSTLTTTSAIATSSLTRTTLEETLVNEDAELLSLNSEETAVSSITLFDLPLSSYKLTDFIISSSLLNGTSLFSSEAHLNAHHTSQTDPILQLTTNWQIFKKNSPIILIYTFPKTIFCQVYYKIVSVYISYYKLTFSDPTLPDIYLLNNNSYTPTVDTEFLNSKFRIKGIKGTTFGNERFIKLYLMNKNSQLLSNDLEISKNKLTLSNTLSIELNKQNRQTIKEFIDKDFPVVNLPIATFIDVNEKVGKFNQNGVIKLFSSGDTKKDLVLASILLILREQEQKKSKGS